MRDLRVGYVPYRLDLNSPADRRRFCFYARSRNIPFEIAKPSERYDLVVIAESADITVWSRFENTKTKLVYDLIDSYLATPAGDKREALRGLAKFATGQHRHLELSYKASLQAMCSRSDAVVCSTKEQQQAISAFCKNVHIILDNHWGVARSTKMDYERRDVFNLVWEGQPQNAVTLYEIRDVLAELRSRHKLSMHIVTDSNYGHYMGKYGKKRTKDVMANLGGNNFFYDWNEDTCAHIITACDLALIPLPLDNPVLAGKPENKLLLFWRMGMPVVVSATPAYARVMQEIDQPMACRSQKEWLGTLEHYISNEMDRRKAGQCGKKYVETNYSQDKILLRWDRLFESVLNIRMSHDTLSVVE